MITSSQGHSASPRVTRQFEFTRLHEQFLAIAYHALIPVVSRPLERPRSRPGQGKPAAAAIPIRTQAGGA
jgi:hypothetical protein